MILYKNNSTGFLDDVDSNCIADAIERAFLQKVGHGVSPNEKRSWENSLYRMGTVVRKSNVPSDCGILLEYNLPSTSKRIDFIIAGQDDQKDKNFIIIELKQWELANATDMEALVTTYVGQGMREVMHPSYQAFSYKQFMIDMNTAVCEHELRPYSCAYLHNYKRKSPEPLLSKQYENVYKDTPIFFKEDVSYLEAFISGKVGQGKGIEIVDSLEQSKIRPSKKFIEYVSDLFAGNSVYTLLDEQQIAYAKIIKYASHATRRTTILVNGGPGTGKSVVAMNAFVYLLKKEKNVCFIAPNSAFKTGVIDSLVMHKAGKKNRMKSIFHGSSGFVDCAALSYDVLIVDEAHRLKSHGAYQYTGDSQVEDIIKASTVNIFFIDDYQQIRPDDEGSVKLIKETAKKYHSEIIEVELKAQFRCSGADGYVNWLDNTLQIRDTANFDGWDEGEYEFKLCDSPNDVEAYVREKNANGYKARMVAGFAWKWTGQKENPDANVDDIDIPEYHFKHPWNSRKARETWAIDETKVNQIGCVHTVQGLEFDYVGVIIGKDLQINLENQELFGDYNNYHDTVGKKGLKDKPAQLTQYIKNIYKILMTRGMKGCAIFCCDQNLQEYFKKRIHLSK